LALVNNKMNTKLLDQPSTESRLILYGVSWQEYEILGATLGNRPNLRMNYLEGTLEIMAPSREHETIKTIIARLLEAYAEEKDIALNGYGSTTFKKQAKQRGLEPDECYCIGEMREVPDIALEVVVSSGGIDKLPIYEGLGVPEVWFWQDSKFYLYRLSTQGYIATDHSEFLPGLDFIMLPEYIDVNNQTRAVKAYRKAIQGA
jgi:Uma2 family endonuclease